MNQIQYENKEKKYLLKGTANNKKNRVLLILVLVVMFILGIILAFSSISKVSTIGNKETGTVDYKVYLKDNDFYQDKYLGKGMQYIASLINTVNISFDYDNKYSSVVNYDYDYDIKAKILVTDKYDTSKVLYEKEEVLLENKHGSGYDDDYILIENIDIDYDKYNSYVTSFKETYALDCDSNLIITMSVRNKSTYNDKEITNKTSDLTISIPLTKNTIDISMNTNKVDSSLDIAIDESMISNKVVFGAGIILSGLSLLSILFLIITKDLKNDIYRKEIDRILKNYDRLIITSSQPSIDETNYKNIVRVMTIEELIDVTEISNEPIIYYEVVPGEKSYFIVLKQDTLYKLTISKAYLEKHKEEKNKTKVEA